MNQMHAFILEKKCKKITSRLCDYLMNNSTRNYCRASNLLVRIYNGMHNGALNSEGYFHYLKVLIFRVFRLVISNFKLHESFDLIACQWEIKNGHWN